MTSRLHTTGYRPGGVVGRLTLSASMIAVAGLGLLSSTPAPHRTLLVGYGSSAPHASAAPETRPSGPGAAGGPAVSSFSISGSVAGLYPGNTRSLVLTVTNPQKVAITVTPITTTVSNASTKCLAANLKVTKFSGHLVVPAGKTAKATVDAEMAHSAPNGCQGAHFPLVYTALATEA
jgi:hypothetical protein